jgi:hypothetical protein
MNRFFRIVVSCSALVGALGVLPGVANAAERPDPPTSIERGHDRGNERGGERDGRWDRDRPGHDRDWRQDGRERARAEHERACRVAWEHGRRCS